MLPSAQTSTVVPLHGRSAMGPLGPSGLVAADKEPQEGDSSRHSSSPSPPPVSSNEIVPDTVAAVTSSSGLPFCSVSQPIITPMMRTRDKICFRHLLMAAAAAAAAALFCVWCVWRTTADRSIDPKTGKVIPYTFQYFIYCLLGGVVAGTVHIMVTPIDLVKCRVQVGEYRSFREGFAQLYWAEADASVLRALPLFFRGWVPTAWGYCIQGALKFSLYEVFKYVLLIGPLERQNAAPPSRDPAALATAPSSSVYNSAVFQLLMFLLSSSLAEVVADVGLAPWEAVKIRMQTSLTCSTSLRKALPRMWELEGLHGFYKGLVPLWCRQVPYTMMKFASFEVIVVNLSSLFVAMGLLDLTHASTLGKLVVSLLAGMLAGVLCGLVSHPADTVLSKLNQKGSNGEPGSGGGATGAPLLASTIAAARNSGIGGHPGGSRDILAVVRDLGWRGVWKGLAPRLLMVSMLTALQWVAYDGFKVFVGLPTSGGVVHK